MEYLTHTGGGEVDENDENCGSTNNNVIFPNLQEQLTHNVFQSGGGDFSCRHIPKQSVDTSSTKWHGYNPERTQGVFIDIHLYGNVYIFPWGNLQYASNPQDAAYRSIMGQLLHYTGLKGNVLYLSFPQKTEPTAVLYCMYTHIVLHIPFFFPFSSLLATL